MSFRLGAYNRIKWPETIKGYDDNGEVVEHQVFFLVEPIPRRELRKLDRDTTRNVMEKASTWLASGDGGSRSKEEIEAFLNDMDQREKAEESKVFKHIVGWDGVEDADTGEPAPFSQKRLKAACDYDPFYQAARRAVRDASRGAVEKN